MGDTELKVMLGVLPGLFALAGTALGYWFSERKERIRSEAEARRHLRDLALQMGLESFKTHKENARPGALMLPLEHYVMHSALMADMLGKERMTEAEITEHLAYVKRVTDTLVESAKH